MKKHYDIILAGGGLAGLSLACHLVHSPLQDRSILIVDQDAKEHDHRTFGFWTRDACLFDAAVCRSWSRLQVAANGYEQLLDLGEHRYKTIRGGDFYRVARQELAAFPSVEFLQGYVEGIEDGVDSARVVVEGRNRAVVAGSWVFDSTLPRTRTELDCQRHTRLRLTFRGWEVETGQPAFDPHVATFMDFRTPQLGDVRFFYVLPFAADRALVEYTLFTAARVPCVEAEKAIAAYLRSVRGIQSFSIAGQEGGCLPITDAPYPRQLGQRVMAVGIRGGRIKPSTGYAFQRIQQDSAAIVESLWQHGHPFAVPAEPPGFRWLDAVMLRVMRNHGEAIAPAFAAMFQKVPIEHILRFLDEATSPWENLQIMASLPAPLFIRTALEMAVPPAQRWIDQWQAALPFVHDRQ